MSRLRKPNELEEMRSVRRLMALMRRRSSHGENGETNKLEGQEIDSKA